MTKVPLVKSVMTPFPYSVDITDTILDASTMMIDHNIRHLPVTDRGKPVGVVSDRDVRRILDSLSKNTAGDNSIRQIAQLGAYVVDLAAPLDAVVLEMARRHINTGLVVKNDRLVGIFTATDIYVYLGNLLRSMFPRGSDDAA